MAKELSISPFQFKSSIKPTLHLGTVKINNSMRFMGGLQIMPTKNLLVGGLISPYKTDEDLSIYYQLLLGYVPKWKLLDISSNFIQIGMHRDRFGSNGDERWFNFSVTENTKLGDFNLQLCWNRLFTKAWEEDTIMIATNIKLNKNLDIRPGAITNFLPHFTYTPFIFASLDL